MYHTRVLSRHLIHIMIIANISKEPLAPPRVPLARHINPIGSIILQSVQHASHHLFHLAQSSPLLVSPIAIVGRKMRAL